MGRLTAADYRGQLRGLLPPGPAWQTEDGDARAGLLTGIAQELSRIDSRANRLVDEADPRETNELLTDYERMCGLPDPCLVSITDNITTSERRAVVVARLRNIGAQTLAYYRELTGSLGYPVEVTEYEIHNVDREVTYPLYAGPWLYAWKIESPDTVVKQFDVMCAAGDPLASWGNLVLECIINRLKPAHTIAIFTYTGE
jgi:uncharacterized protein YmfQ (DUF2313 family)